MKTMLLLKGYIYIMMDLNNFNIKMRCDLIKQRKSILDKI